jgi:hypothetical protein
VHFSFGPEKSTESDTERGCVSLSVHKCRLEGSQPQDGEVHSQHQQVAESASPNLRSLCDRGSEVISTNLERKRYPSW